MDTLNNKCFTGCTTNNPAATSGTLQQEVITIINTSLRKYIDNLPAFVAVEVPKVKLNFTEGEVISASEVANPMFNWALQMCLTAVAEDTELSFNEVLSALREQQSLFAKAANWPKQPADRQVLIEVSRGFKNLSTTKRGQRIAFRIAKQIQRNFLES